ncbi:MAG: hypothetical protein GF416_06355 [Candidatus Altiarchaeales archaeon]|nr:hypothetical protein [Candidatus Altiarchaeales archaeon]MBD3416736.1 hypothetical protein [Candidatus Altiarchaeales archaeon]
MGGYDKTEESKPDNYCETDRDCSPLGCCCPKKCTGSVYASQYYYENCKGKPCPEVVCNPVVTCTCENNMCKTHKDSVFKKTTSSTQSTTTTLKIGTDYSELIHMYTDKFDSNSSIIKCQNDDDCILVPNIGSCNAGGINIAINKDFQEGWNKQLNEERRGMVFAGVMSQHSSCFSNPVCNDNKCTTEINNTMICSQQDIRGNCENPAYANNWKKELGIRCEDLNAICQWGIGNINASDFINWDENFGSWGDEYGTFIQLRDFSGYEYDLNSSVDEKLKVYALRREKSRNISKEFIAFLKQLDVSIDEDRSFGKIMVVGGRKDDMQKVIFHPYVESYSRDNPGFPEDIFTETELKYCMTDDDCISIEAYRNGCTAGGTSIPMNKKFKEYWTDKRLSDTLFTGTTGVLSFHWSCFAIPKCLNHRCALVNTTCSSPEDCDGGYYYEKFSEGIICKDNKCYGDI